MGGLRDCSNGELTCIADTRNTCAHARTDAQDGGVALSGAAAAAAAAAAAVAQAQAQARLAAVAANNPAALAAALMAHGGAVGGDAHAGAMGAAAARNAAMLQLSMAQAQQAVSLADGAGAADPDAEVAAGGYLDADGGVAFCVADRYVRLAPGEEGAAPPSLYALARRWVENTPHALPRAVRAPAAARTSLPAPLAAADVARAVRSAEARAKHAGRGGSGGVGEGAASARQVRTCAHTHAHVRTRLHTHARARAHGMRARERRGMCARTRRD